MDNFSLSSAKDDDRLPGPDAGTSAADGQWFRDDEIPDAPQHWTIEDFRDILPGQIR